MARCSKLVTVFLSWALLMFSWCKGSRISPNGYDHSYKRFKSDSLINRKQDITGLRSFVRASLRTPTTVSVSDFGAKGDGKTDDTQVNIYTLKCFYFILSNI